MRDFLPCLVLLCGFLTACAGPKVQPVSDQEVIPVLAETYVLTADAYTLPLRQRWPKGDARAIVLALHGFNDYSRAFEGMCEYLVNEKIACLAYDQRGFGETKMRGIWAGEEVLTSDAALLIRLLRQKYPDTPLYAAGESMGGAVLMVLLDDEKHKAVRQQLSGVALFAPAVWARDTQPWYQRMGLWLAVNIAPSWTPTGESLEIVATDNIEALRAMGRDPNVIKETRIDSVYGLTNLMDQALAASQPEINTLVLYGERDEVIPKRPTCEMLSSMWEERSETRVKLYPQGYHMLTRDLQAPVVFNDVSQWVSNGELEGASKEQIQQFCASD